MWCHGGSGGAFMIRLPAGAICVKNEHCKHSMLFAQALSKALDVRLGEMRAVLDEHQECKAIRTALHQAPTFDEPRRHVGRHGALIVTEYVTGCPMMGADAQE